MAKNDRMQTKDGQCQKLEAVLRLRYELASQLKIAAQALEKAGATLIKAAARMSTK
jgi:hypothetical protein